MGDIVAFVNNRQAMRDLPRYELLSGGFPCQTFSMMGSQEGFEEERGQMFFRIMDMINSRHPRYVLLENVKNLMIHDGGNTITVIRNELENAGYIVKMDIFNSNNYGLPQKRNRVIIFARRRHLGDFEFSSERVREAFDDIERERCSLNFYDTTIDVLDKYVSEKYYLSEKIKPTLLSDGSAGFKSKSEIDQTVARPLTATMHKMHRACQDNYFSDLYIQSNGANRPSERMTKEELSRIPIRKLTPKEAFMLQGFPVDFAERANLARVADGAMYKQAGNAVSVNTIYAVLYYLITNRIIRQ
jgi:DNA (cytosine-5)-methyltransferase 1